MFSSDAVRLIRIFLISFCSLVVVFLSFRFFSEFRGAQSRGRFVVSLLSEHESEIRKLESSSRDLASRRSWPDDYLELQRWLILDILDHQDPQRTARELESLSLWQSYSPVMHATLDRWEDTLRRWSYAKARMEDLPASPEALLEEGRRRHYEASGYQKVGRLFDATVLYLWAADDLSRFIRLAPARPEIPEALYLIGDSYIRFRHALPRTVRADRLLNLCDELFPGSVWSERAQLLWRNEMGTDA